MSNLRWVLRAPVAVVVLAAALGAGCDGCSKKSAERASPLRYIPQDADAVLEIRDLALLGDAREAVATKFAALVTKQQIEGLQQELVRAFGFDPTTKEGLAQAGLPSSGPMAANVLANGKGAVWVVPVADKEKLAPVLLKIVKARVSVDKTSTTKAGEHEITLYTTQFGADDLQVAAHVFVDGYVLIAAGKTSADLLKAALALTPEQSIDKSKEFLALSKSLDPAWDVRMISPRGGETMKGALRTAARSLPQARALLGADFSAVSSVGWSADMSTTGVKVKGELRLTEAGKKIANEIFAAPGEPGPGVRAVAIPEAVVFAQLALQPQAIIDLLAPVGSPARGQFDVAKANAKKDANIDFETEILPQLTGHAAVALGLGGLDKVSFQELVGNPRGVIWTAAGVGVKEPAKAVEIEARLDEGLKTRGFSIVTREVKGKSVRGVVPPQDPREPQAPAALVETTGFGGAWVFANEGPLMDRVAGNESGASGLGGKGGFYLELNLRELNKQLAAFRYGDLPVLYRSLLAKVMDAVKLLSSLKVRVHPSADGVTMSGELELVPLAGS